MQISKYKIVLSKIYRSNWTEEVFATKRVNNTLPSTYLIDGFNAKEISGSFYKQDLQQINKYEFRIENLINKRGVKLYVKLKGCDNS